MSVDTTVEKPYIRLTIDTKCSIGFLEKRTALIYIKPDDVGMMFN